MTVENRWLKLAAPGIAGLNPYIPGKPLEELERELGLSETFKLASNENPLGPSPLGLAAARKVVGGINLYPDDNGYALRNLLADQHGLKPGQILLGAGSSDVLNMVARTFLSPGVNAVYSAHSFAMYAIYTQATGAKGKVAAPFPPDHEMPYGHDLDAMAELVDEKTRVIFIANPNNPTGTWIGREELEAFIGRIPENVIIVLDEAYTQYVESDDFPDGTAWVDRYPNLMVTRTFSKIYGLAGLRVGYGVASTELIELTGRIRHPFNVNLVALAAAEGALGDQAFVEHSVAVNSAGLKQFNDGFRQLGLKTIPSVGNFICVEFDRPGTEVYDELLKRGFIVRPVANYDMPNHLRITVGTENENARLLLALAEVLKK